ncbi:MAG: hypothetical protein JSU68_06260 [Phycisphaerales bacterium]|nr:MAG: hypothetical protein JSU68_06260 [Phycisphaerales bacterium]
MKRVTRYCLIVSLLVWTACSCKDNEPPRRITVPEYKPGEVDQPDQTDPNTCFGDKAEEEPDFDVAMDIVKEGELMNFVITLADKKGLRVCGIRLRIAHRAEDPETGEWKPTSEEAYVNVPRLEPNEVLERVTRLSTNEFPSVTGDPGPPEAWSITVDSYNDVRQP